MFRLLRETEEGTITVYKGTKDECLKWMQSCLALNTWKVNVLTDLNMRPVYSCESQYGTKKVFFLREENPVSK